VLALAWPEATGVLLDRRARAAGFLEDAVEQLGLSDRLTVAHARAEDAARTPELRGRFPLVVARSFGGPATTSECAVGFLTRDGRLAVSEPPHADPSVRWPSDGIGHVGLTGPEILRSGSTTVAVLTLSTEPAGTWPRSPGTPKKRPLW
jgi:hypothetical protein